MQFNWTKLSPDDGHYFFGYYDRCPWDGSERYHLALKVGQCERLPLPGETAEIGLLDRENPGTFTPVATTRAWCHQQGSMTLWLKNRPGCFCYNDIDEAGRVVTRIYQLGKGVVRTVFPAFYAVSPDGRWAVSLNFARIPRRGYSYAEAYLPAERHPDPDSEGITLIDLGTFESRLIVSYRRMMELHPCRYELDELYLWLNHAIFNCDSTRLLWLFRQCQDERRPRWKTFMYTSNLDGGELRCPLPDFYWHGMISHQIWGRTPNEILIDANWRGKGSEYLVFDERELPLRAERISAGQGPMGHLVFSPDGRTMLADTYPDADGRQYLALVEAATGKLVRLGSFLHRQPAGTPGDVRCDLHPRWSQSGRFVTVDSIDDGRRGVYLLELPPKVDFSSI